MTLPSEHLVYDRRRYGMDQDLYAWRPRAERPRLTWPGGKSVAVMIVCPLEFHMLDPGGKPFKHPGAMATPYPDLRHYTTRDYGLRVGAFRLLKGLRTAGLKATFPLNAVLLDRVRPLVDAILEDGHEIAAYGWDTNHIHWSGLSPAEERTLTARVRERFDRAGLTPRTWMSPARQQSFHTLELVAEQGFDVCLDWEQDTTPTPMTTSAGVVQAVPLSNELDDRLLMIDRHQSEASWSAQILEAAACMKGEADRFGGQVLGFTLTSYVSGQPFRTLAVREMLQAMAADPAVWTATAGDIADAAATSP
jgi:allantoinase